MSEAAFSYGGLRDAASDARGVARRCNAYADSIERTVRDKLDKYSGDWSDDLQTAKRRAEEKTESLRETAGKYQALSDGLNELRDACKRTDRAVRSEVSSLTASFKKAHDIRDNAVVNFVSFCLTKWGNSSMPGRWLNVQFDKAQADADYLRQTLKTWYNYEGGRTLLTSILQVAASVALAIAAVVSGGPLLVVIAAVVGAAIVAVNGLTDLIYEGFAYYHTKYGDDPALGKRCSDISTFSDFLRRETNSKALHALATGLDIAAFASAAITLVHGFKELFGRGLRWANDTAKLSFRDYFSKSNWSGFLGKAKTSLKTGAGNAWDDIKDIFRAAKSGNFAQLQNVARITKQSFLGSLKDFYTLDFSARAQAGTAIKNIGYVLQGLSFTLDAHSIPGALAKVSFAALVLPGVGGLEVFHPNELHLDASRRAVRNGEAVKVLDFGERLEDMKADGLWGLSRRRLSQTSQVNIATPDITMPDFSKMRFNPPDFSAFFALNPVTVPAFRLERLGWDY